MSQTSELELTLKRWISAIDVEALVDEIVLSLARSVPSHRRMSEDVRSSQIAPIVRHIVSAAMISVANGTDLSAETIERMTSTARQRGVEGEPLEDILLAYRVASRHAWRTIRRLAGPDDGAALVRAAERMMALQEVVTLTVTRAYIAESSSLVSEQERSARHLLEALDERTARWSEDADIAKTYHLEVGGPFLPFALALPGEKAPGHALAARRMRDAGVLALSEGDRVVGLLPPISGTTTIPGLAESAIHTIGSPVEPGRIESSLAILRGVIAVAGRQQRRGIVTIADVAPELLLEMNPPVAEALARSIFDPLPDELVKTLETLIAHEFDRRTAADALHVHRNTIVYRLRQITAATGRDLNSSADLVAIILAHSVRRAQQNRL